MNLDSALCRTNPLLSPLWHHFLQLYKNILGWYLPIWNVQYVTSSIEGEIAFNISPNLAFLWQQWLNQALTWCNHWWSSTNIFLMEFIHLQLQQVHVCWSHFCGQVPRLGGLSLVIFLQFIRGTIWATLLIKGLGLDTPGLVTNQLRMLPSCCRNG